MKIKKIVLLVTLTAILLSSCGEKSYIATSNIDEIAESYVKLAFSLGRYDKDYVDGYFGSEELKAEALQDTLTLEEIIKYSGDLLFALHLLDEEQTETDSITLKRAAYLEALILAMKTRAEIASGKKYNFDQESKLIYEVVSPTYSLDYYNSILAEIDTLLPPAKKENQGINERWNAFRSRFIIPREKLDTIFKVAIAECRSRTKEYINLPPDESFDFEFVENKPWGAYNWYKGNGKSLIQINVSMPIYIDRVIDYACHEGYPGHHVYHLMHELKLYKEKGWIEHSVIPLFSPSALLSEGLANFGIDVAFTKEEKLNYEKDVLCKIAGIDGEGIESYYRILNLKNKLRYAGIEAARRYLDGKISKEQAINFLMNFQLRTRQEAENSISFFETYRSYVITYSIGVDMLKEYFRKHNATTKTQRWNLYYRLLSNPVLPEDLRN
jgi:hypothetical protein